MFLKNPFLNKCLKGLVISSFCLVTPITQAGKLEEKKIIKDPSKIQLAILLDTSNSMDGLIDQTRNQLWQIVNEFSKAEKNGRKPILEVSVYEYGNSDLPASEGHVKRITHLTRELDEVSEALFGLDTNGGNEFCGYVISDAVKQLEWSDSSADIKTIFIAGNEPFTQGPVPYQEAISTAMKEGITVNTIFAGNYQEGINGGWLEGSKLASGYYMSIDHNSKIAHIEAPQDELINKLNQALNDTYIPYGKDGTSKLMRQKAQDVKSEEVAPSLLAKRAVSKASSFYNNSQWDLVDAVESGEADLENLNEKDLPESLKGMDKDERINYVKEKTAERKSLKAEIAKLAKDRDEYITAEKKKLAEKEVDTVGDVISETVRKQGQSKGYTF